jgi:hypothetical protein
MSTPSNRYMNYGPVSLGGVAITGVTAVGLNMGISIKKEGGDADAGPTLVVQDWMDPTFTVKTLDAFAAQAQLGGVRGIFIATILDAYNKAAAGGGAKVITTNSSSLVGDAGMDSQYRDFATESLTIQTQWVDPATPPYSITAA